MYVCICPMVKLARMGRNDILQPISGIPPPEIAVTPPKVVDPPPGDAILSP